MHFAKHETFYIREGWLFKGMAAIKRAEDHNQLPTIFLDNDGPERLGIGRNMVRALRYWIEATGLAAQHLEQRQAVHRLTEFGAWVWQYDRYLEDRTSLWLIHYHLITNRELATTWYWFFNHYAPAAFEPDACLESLKLWVLAESNKSIAEASLKKDISCLIRTYVPSEKKRTPEELTESPLARLGLMLPLDSQAKQPSRYRLERANPLQLDPLVMLYVLVDRQHKVRPNEQQVSLEQVLRESLNAGRVFNLTTTTITELLALLNRRYPDWRVQFVRTEGLDYLTLPAITPQDVLNRYVEREPLGRVA